MSGCCVLLYFKPVNDFIPCFPGCKWLPNILLHFILANASPWLSSLWVVTMPCYISMPAHHAYPWLFSMWVPAVSCCSSTLLTILILDSLVCEWLHCPEAFLLMLHVFGSSVGEGLLCLAHVKPHVSYPWLFRKWVAMVSFCVSGLLTNLVSFFPVCGWLLCFAAFQSC